MVFEDNLDAINTAKKNGFITIAIEDKSNIYNKEILKTSADYYLNNFNNDFLKYFKNIFLKLLVIKLKEPLN